MIKLLDTLNEEQSWDNLIDTLYTIDNERFKVTNVDIVDKEKYVIIEFHLILREITSDTFNIFYGTVAEMILNAGYTTNLESVALSVSYFTVEHESGLRVEGIRVLPREIFNRLKYDLPPVSTILKSQYSLVIPKTSTLNVDAEMDTMLKSKKKKSTVYYTLLKKGTVVGHDYELVDNPLVKLNTKGGVGNAFNHMNITPEIIASFKSIDGIPWGNEHYPEEYHVRIEDALKEKFSKQNIDFSISPF